MFEKRKLKLPNLFLENYFKLCTALFVFIVVFCCENTVFLFCDRCTVYAGRYGTISPPAHHKTWYNAAQVLNGIAEAALEFQLPLIALSQASWRILGAGLVLTDVWLSCKFKMIR